MNPILPLEYLMPLLAAILLGSLYSCWRSTIACAMRLRILWLFCRAAALAGLAIIALNPGHWTTLVRNQDSEWAILLDHSASMATADVENQPRLQTAMRLARQAYSFSDSPKRVRAFVFSDHLEPLSGPPETWNVEPEAPERATDILRACDELLGRYRALNQKLSGVLLLSDGRQIMDSRNRDPALDARAQATPFHVCPLGGAIEQRDLEIAPARRHYLAFTGQLVHVRAWLSSRNLDDLRPRARLLDAGGVELAADTPVLRGNDKVPVDFEFAATKAGFSEYRLAVDAWPGETRLENNEARFGVSVLDHPIRILVLEGQPHWDNKFLLQLLRQHPQFTVTAIHRLSDSHYFRVETGAEAQLSEASAFLDSARDFAQYDVIIAGKGLEYFLTPDRIRHLRAWLQDHGGILLFSRGKPFYGTWEAMETLAPLAWGDLQHLPMRWQPTQAGVQSGLFGELLPGPGDPLWQKLPPLGAVWTTQRLYPFAQKLAEATLEGHPGSDALPLIVSRPFGRGLVVAMNAEGLWQWDFFPQHQEASTFYKTFWGELLQWCALASDFLPGRAMALRLNTAVAAAGEPVKAVMDWRETDTPPEGQPELRAYQEGRLVQQIPLRPSTVGAPQWGTVFSLSQPGLYRLEASWPPHQADALLRIQNLPRELDDTSADPAFLAALAERSGGRVITEAELKQAVADFLPHVVALEEGTGVWESAWPRAWLLLLLAAALGCEWFGRRRNGLL